MPIVMIFSDSTRDHSGLHFAERSLESFSSVVGFFRRNNVKSRKVLLK